MYGCKGVRANRRTLHVRRVLLFVAVMALALVVAAPAGAASGDKVKTLVPGYVDWRRS
jgi:hypothetical protein